MVDFKASLQKALGVLSQPPDNSESNRRQLEAWPRINGGECHSQSLVGNLEDISVVGATGHCSHCGTQLRGLPLQEPFSILHLFLPSPPKACLLSPSHNCFAQSVLRTCQFCLHDVSETPACIIADIQKHVMNTSDS